MKIFRTSSINIKILLILIAAVISFGTLYYTRILVEKLQERDRELVELYAKTFKYIASSTDVQGDFTFLFDNIIKRIDFPLILTDSEENVHNYSTGSGTRNLEIDSTLSEEETDIFLKNKIEELRVLHNPIEITYNDSIILGKIFYGDSEIVTRLKYYPYLQILFAGGFMILSYLGFSFLKKSEQSNIYVGMARETAHQLGTPISSLMGWNELLKMQYEQPEKVMNISNELVQDLNRLNKIANRFSKIGSIPKLQPENLDDVIKKVIEYFEKRLPQTGKNVSLILEGNTTSQVDLNADLFEWVIENLIKNALDAIETENGEILFVIKENKETIKIDVTDNGKGIDIKKRNEIFRPGYSTKRRGWGLGLSLSKRIIEDYHKGKIFLKSSVIGKGSTFQILLKK